MKIESAFDKCIYCVKRPADSWEHIIPASIGGRLQIKALCSRCNNTLGSELVSKVRMAGDIRCCIQNLKREIPDLYESMEKGLPYLAKGNDDTIVKLIRKNGRFFVLSEQKEGGSIIYDRREAGKYISRRLKKDGLPEHEIVEKIESLKRLKPDVMIQLSNNLKAVNRKIGSIEQCFVDLKDKRVQFLDERVVVLMAYEFLSLLMGNLIRDHTLHFIRDFIREGETSDRLVVGHYMTGSYSPDHGIYAEFSDEQITINIILFGWWWYKVHLKGVVLSSPDFVYAEDLRNRKPVWAKSIDEAKRNIWYEFGN